MTVMVLPLGAYLRPAPMVVAGPEVAIAAEGDTVATALKAGHACRKAVLWGGSCAPDAAILRGQAIAPPVPIVRAFLVLPEPLARGRAPPPAWHPPMRV